MPELNKWSLLDYGRTAHWWLGVEEVLAAHESVAYGLGEWCCKCSPREWRPSLLRPRHVAEHLQPLIRQAQAEAWDAGYVAGGCDSRIVEGDPERNPYLAGGA